VPVHEPDLAALHAPLAQGRGGPAVLYLRGLSTGDFRPALEGLLGEEASGLSATNIARLTGVWEEEYRAFRKRSLKESDYLYVWADGEQARGEQYRGNRARLFSLLSVPHNMIKGDGCSETRFR
jgi:hypothetical protein